MPAISTTRLRIIGSVSALLTLLVLAVVGCAGGGGEYGGGGEQGGSKEEGAPPVTGSFVGVAPDVAPEAEAFVALVASGAEEEGEAQRQVRAYLCDGQSINEWFNEGSVEGVEFDLTSDGGAHLLGSLKQDVDSSWVSGQIFLADGTVLSFSIPPATGIAGLYDVSISGGELSGTSEGGGQLEGRLGETPQENGLYPVAGIITPADGYPQDFQAFATSDASGELRFIVLEDGRFKGGPKKGEGEGFIEQT